MSEESNKKLLAHYTKLMEGSVKTGNPTRDDLIVSDAARHLADLIEKNPSLKVEEVKETKPIKEETKSLEKK